MTTDIMQIWAEIAAGALPEGVEVYAHDPKPSAFTMVINGCRQAFVTRASTEAWHRYAMLLVVDGWERQGKTFGRDRVTCEDSGNLEYYWDCCRGKYCLTSCAHERETIALGNVLAELGRAVKEGQA